MWLYSGSVSFRFLKNQFLVFSLLWNGRYYFDLWRCVWTFWTVLEWKLIEMWLWNTLCYRWNRFLSYSSLYNGFSHLKFDNIQTDCECSLHYIVSQICLKFVKTACFLVRRRVFEFGLVSPVSFQMKFWSLSAYMYIKHCIREIPNLYTMYTLIYKSHRN